MDVRELLATLARQRPIFHSEADFQHALAWAIHEACPAARVRLEIPRDIDGRRAHVDVWVVDDDSVAIELEYLTGAAEVKIEDEQFRLVKVSTNLGRYDVLKDLVRIERLVGEGSADRGIMVALSNDPDYWSEPGWSTTPKYTDLRLTEGRTLSGTLQWGPGTGARTMLGREAPIDLWGKYVCEWTDYSVVGSGASEARFRYLLLEARRLEGGPTKPA
jgi:hypothetical protein